MKINNVKNLIQILIAVLLISTFFGVPTYIIGLTVQLFMNLIVSALLSAISGALIEAFTGDLLKKYLFVINIKGINIPLTLFFISTVLLKIWLFH